MGRRMGGMYQYQAPTASPQPVTEGDEKTMLKKQLEQLEQQLMAAKKRLEELEK